MEQLIDPQHFECIFCWNCTAFSVADIERLGESASWNVLIKCSECGCGQNVKYNNIHFEKRLRKYLSDILGKQKSKQKPTSYVEFEYLTGKIHRTSHPDGIFYEEYTI